MKSSQLYDILWIKVTLGEEFLFLGIVYMSPIDTTRDVDSEQQLLELEDDMMTFKKEGKVMVMGDFNRRIGNMGSQIIRKGQCKKFSRMTEDKSVKGYVAQMGKLLLDTMNSCEMIILNGIDSGHSFTSYQENGQSIVDYIMINYTMFEPEQVPEQESEEEDDMKIKMIFTEKKATNKNNKIGIRYKPKSMKVWTDLTSIMSDHRVITCEILTSLNRKEEKKEEKKEDVKQKDDKIWRLQSRKVMKWRRRDGGDLNFWIPLEREADTEMKEWRIKVEDNGNGDENKERYCEKLNKSFVEKINQICKQSIGVVKEKKTRKRKLIWPDDIYQLKCRETEAHHKWIEAQPDEKADLYRKYRIISKERRRKTRKHEKEQLEKIIEEIEKLRSKDSKEYWNRLKKLSEVQNSKKEKLPMKMKNNRGEFVEGEEMLKVWAEAFYNLGQEDKESNYDEEFRSETAQIVKEIEECMQDDEGDPELEKPITLEEVQKGIQLLKRGKAVGIDGVCNEIFKYGGTEMEMATWKLFNEIWSKDERFPLDWSRGLIFPLFKGGPMDFTYNPLKYRGITLLSVIGKLYTTILNERLMKWCESKKVLVEEQAGFRKNRSTIDQLFIIHEIVQLRKPKKTYCCFIDIQKAYDRVWRDGLWKLLYKYDIKGKMWRVLKNIYENVQSSVLVNDYQTEFFNIEVGLRQGCVLSPILFSIFINELAEKIKKLGKGVQLGKNKISILLFADDIVLIADNKKDLELMMQLTHEISRKWRFNFNYDKSAVMIFEETKVKDIKYQYGDCKNVCTCGKHWKFGDQLIVETATYKYLGIELDKNLTFFEFKNRVAEKAKKNRARIWHMGMKSGDLSVKASINLWDALVKSILEYGAAIWGAQDWNEAEIIQHEMGRRILRCHGKTTNEAVLGELGWWSMRARREFIRLKYWINILLMEEIRLVKQVYRYSRQICIQKLILKQKNDSWLKDLYELIKKYGLYDLWQNEELVRNPPDFKEEKTEANLKRYWKRNLSQIIQNREEKQWKADMAGQPKLRTYRQFKEKLQLEEYLMTQSNKQGRYLLTSIRTGTNKLRIETGRWKKEKKDERFCMVCMSGEIEDEKHFVLDCEAYQHARQILFNQIQQASNGKLDLQNHSREAQWNTLMRGNQVMEPKLIFENLKIFLVSAHKRRKMILGTT